MALNPKRLLHQDRGLSLAEMIILLVILLISAAIIIPGVHEARQRMTRAVCSANIRGIIQGMVIYAQTNQNTLPCVPPPPIAGVFPNGPAGIIAQIKPKSRAALVYSLFHNSSAFGSPLACMWLLVAQKFARPREFLCPADPFAVAPSLLYSDKDHFYSCFGVPVPGYGASGYGVGESYSISFPWAGRTVGPWWNANADASVPLVSDMAPMQDPNNAYGDFQRNCKVPRVNAFPKFIFNTGNFRGIGQNVGFGDCHVVFETSPYVGENHDNIFTWGSKAANAELGGGKTIFVRHSVGRGPRRLSPKKPYDTRMVPVRSVMTGAW